MSAVSFAPAHQSFSEVKEDVSSGAVYQVTKPIPIPKKDRPAFGSFTPTAAPNAGTSLKDPGYLGNNETENTARMYESLDLFEPFADGIDMVYVPNIGYYKSVKKGNPKESMYARIEHLVLPFQTTTFNGPGFSKTTARMNIPEAIAQNLVKLAQYMGKLASIPQEIDVSKVLYKNEKGYWSYTISINNQSLVYLNDGSPCMTMPQIPPGEYKNVLIQLGIYHNQAKGVFQLTSSLGRGEFRGPRGI